MEAGMRCFAVALFGLLLTGCADSGVMKVGPDTYMVSATRPGISGDVTAAKQAALKQGQEYCTKQGKQLLVQHMDDQVRWDCPGTSNVTFLCLAEGDPELQRPKYRKEPDVIIEQRQ
jgi:hypothetical protein